MDSETLKLTHYFGEPSVFLQNKENFVNLQQSLLKSEWLFGEPIFHPTRVFGPTYSYFPPYSISKFSTQLVYLALLFYEIYLKYPPYSFIWPYSFNWHLKVTEYL